jgi:hypothetical protein
MDLGQSAPKRPIEPDPEAADKRQVSDIEELRVLRDDLRVQEAKTGRVQVQLVELRRKFAEALGLRRR